MPLSQACYVASVDKIFGIYGPYIIKFNAVTGAREAQAIVRSPGEATCGLVFHAATGLLYVSTWNSMGNQYEFTPHPDVDIFPVNPASLAVGAGLGWSNLYPDSFGRMEWPNGPRMLFDFGNAFIYFIGGFGSLSNVMWMGRIDPTAPAADAINMGNLNFWSEQGCTDGSWVYFPRAWGPEIERADMALSVPSVDSVPFAEVGQIMPVSVEHSIVNNKQYVLSGNQWMTRIDSWAGVGSYTILNLDVVNSGSEPIRLRYRTSDSKLYIPCQTTDGVIMWNPQTETGIWKSGFSSPIDVVFTGSRAFAVQNSPVGLKEIM